eukprot:gene9065-16191_t
MCDPRSVENRRLVSETAAQVIQKVVADPLIRVTFTSASVFLPIASLMERFYPEEMLLRTASVLKDIVSISRGIRKEMLDAGLYNSLFSTMTRSPLPRVRRELWELHMMVEDVCECSKCISKRKQFADIIASIGVVVLVDDERLMDMPVSDLVVTRVCQLSQPMYGGDPNVR